jgi:hypothetical protein
MYAQMKPLAHQIKDSCQEFYQISQRIIQLLERTHEILKWEFQQSLELTKKRLRIILWFQQNQYTK